MLDERAQQLLAHVEKSPAAVAIHDKAAWMNIFAKFHIVEDPIGSTPHIGGLYDSVSGERGNGPLSRFYDTFIAPNKLSFDVKRDIVCANHVVRDLSINIQMSDKVHAQVPMHLLYELVQEDGELKVVHLAAHWELMPMITQILAKGFACFPVLTSLTVKMFKNQGVKGMLGFSKAALNIGKKGKACVKTFEQAWNGNNLSELMSCFCSDAKTVAWPVGESTVNPSQLFEERAGKLTFTKIMSAGDCVTASLLLKTDNGDQEGVAIFEFNRALGKIAAVKFYLNAL